MQMRSKYNQNVDLKNGSIGNLRQQISIENYGVRSVRHNRYRTEIIKLIQRYWIRGNLEKSQHDLLPIEIFWSVEPDAVRPLRAWDKDADAEQGLSNDIVQTFESLGCSLLILGESGVGKTTVLLELARSTLQSAQHDSKTRIPIVLHLSTWQGTHTDDYLKLIRNFLLIYLFKKDAFSSWLIDELKSKYGIPTEISRDWVRFDDLVLFLDGLDELSRERQSELVDAINIFRQEHPQTHIAITCRKDAYYSLGSKLMLENAILIKPLTPGQIEEYLSTSRDDNLRSLYRSMKDEVSLKNFITTPMILRMVVMSYRNLSIEKMRELASENAIKEYLVETYVADTIAKHALSFKTERIYDTLGWLAKKLKKIKKQEIGEFDTKWLETGQRKKLYWILGSLSVSGELLYIAFAILFSPFVFWIIAVPIVGTALVKRNWEDVGMAVLLALFPARILWLMFEPSVVKTLLSQQGYIPHNFSQFLTEMADAEILQKTGGTYSFRHAILQEYFEAN